MINLIEIRRQLHQIPEIGLEEHKTQKYLLTIIHQIIQNKSFIQVETWQTGLLVYLKGSQGQKTIGWRTDIDGLPVEELTNLPFASKNGRMHACGHDIHMTVALGLLEKLSESQPKNNLLFLFQPAEENEAGGKLMYDGGAFKNWLPDEFYGLHVRPDLKVGDIATNEQTLFAGTCEVELTFVGTGGHAAFPHTANDALVAAAYFVTQVQTIVSRNVDPLDSAVVTFGKMEAGTTNNIIAERAFLHGTIRSLTQEVNELTQKRLTELAKGVAQSFDMTIDLKLKQGGYLPVENNPKLAKELMDFFRNETKANLIDIAPAMTGEDFGYLLSKIPGVMFWLGINSEAPLHSQKMQADEGVLDFAVEAIGQFLDFKANRN
ncbi:MAG: N-acetyldiaminopimelate deacetylase [Lactococcus cremoris]|jgi:N-acetyldiaminopimelate deacetylase|uniref:N-acetyldiaminopimelate deacetylase n=2 Tax=Lactococcus lactis subsp. cremoris TaxID=1359 RepID=A0AAX4A8L1_LACLC|nr:N-acetyldiaminopimelate deacetylase [Lactococcus cremoris]MCI1841867.1 N-acetyldiaminopimelate deacetylase [Lactococcus lactis]KEY62366.1 N-acetyldiaminopimelate deacetylase [Lactococcus cremoris subsp. cremoris GE214]KGH32725.1 N-acetyldiaminopimelate deacetylase [Lactococcus cremoris]KKW70182.1 amidohydrolase [Lactococcus cremoris]KZK06694.1 N-acetyl-LL-diaminopimelate deacetylase [Lactococcus cremoris]